MQRERYDVIVLGSGAAGVSAAIAAAESGAKVGMIERGPIPGGELIGGLPILGAANGEGQWVVRGVLERLISRLEPLGGYVGLFFDWRTMWGVCIDPELMKLVVIDELVAAGVTMRLATQAIDVVVDGGGHVEGILTTDGNHERMMVAESFVDASGDAWLAARAGAEIIIGDGAGDLQPVSLTFRMSGVDVGQLLEFVGSNPEQLIVAENPIITEDAAGAARRIAESGQPFFSLSGERGTTLLGRAIEQGTMFPTTAYYTWPTSVQRREVGLNVTRLPGVDGADARSVSKALGTLSGQVQAAAKFLVATIPGYQNAALSGVAGRVGVRETGRIVGEHVLETDEVLAGVHHPEGVARGAHHVDIHGAGTYQLRRYIAEGRSFDIPLGALKPVGVDNVMVAGRCVSSTREANGSARVMGPCMAMGEAAGVAAAFAAQRDGSTAAVDARAVRSALASRGALIGNDVP